jgi:amino acid transporter
MKAVEHSLFDRQRSGYTREFNVLDVFIFNILGFALGLALSTNTSFIGGFAPQSNIMLVILMGAILAFFNGLVYGWFGAIMPNTGGDYVFVSRTINHRIGFLTNWGFTICQLYGFAANVSWIFSMAIRPSLLAVGFTSDIPGLFKNVTDIDSHIWLFISLGVALFYYLISLLNQKLGKTFIILMFILGMMSPLIMAYLLLTHSNQDFITAFNAYVSRSNGHLNAYQTVVEAARKSMVGAPHPSVFMDSLKALPLGFLCFLGFTYSVYAGGEIEKPERAQVRGIIGSLLVGLVTFLICMGRYTFVVGKEFHTAIGGPVQATLGITNAPVNFLTGLLAEQHPILNILMQIGNLVWFLLVPYVILQVCTRNVIAWACDEMMPGSFLKRMSSTNAPWVASLAVTLVGMLIILFIYLTNVSLVGAAALAAAAYLFTSYAAYQLPKANPQAYAKAPKIAKRKVFGSKISFFQMAGILSFIGFIWIIYASIFNHDLAQGDSGMALTMILAVYIIGLCIYEWRKYLLSKKTEDFADFDLNELFKEIPED